MCRLLSVFLKTSAKKNSLKAESNTAWSPRVMCFQRGEGWGSKNLKKYALAILTHLPHL